MPSTHGKDPLYRDLEKTGSRRVSLEPTRMLDCQTLLHCNAVNRRVPTGATDIQRAIAAREAIIECVGLIKDTTDQQIAEAVLCTDTSYASTAVETRKKRLDQEHGITEKTFTRRRPPLLRQLAHDLTVVPSKAPPIHTPGSKKFIGYNVSCLWRDAFTLHCAGLASLFVSQDNGIPFGSRGAIEACAESLFDALTIFLYGSYYSCVVYPSMMEKWLERCLDRERIDWLLRTVRLLNSYCPLLQQLEPDEGSLLFEFMPAVGKGGMHIRDLYTTIWKPWYFAEHDSGAHVITDIERITAQSGAIGTVLHDARCVGINQPLESQIHLEAFRSVESYYGHTADEALADGQSLLGLYDAFCLNSSPALVKNALL